MQNLNTRYAVNAFVQIYISSLYHLVVLNIQDYLPIVENSVPVDVFIVVETRRGVACVQLSLCIDPESGSLLHQPSLLNGFNV